MKRVVFDRSLGRVRVVITEGEILPIELEYNPIGGGKPVRIRMASFDAERVSELLDEALGRLSLLVAGHDGDRSERGEEPKEDDDGSR